MAIFLVSYDLRKPGRDYKSLYQAIHLFGANIHPLESIWFISSNASAAQVRNTLTKHIDPNDGLLVLESGKTAAWLGLTNDDSSRLKATIEAIR